MQINSYRPHTDSHTDTQRTDTHIHKPLLNTDH